ncbi:MAG: hypothetical protein KAS53_00715 [Candidatus Cloacimonetes bacterium]|nr:hypothetical protein [Candidatus Cloacimonadota bacterium]
MGEQTYTLLSIVLVPLIAGLFGITNTIITLRAKRKEKVVIERTNEGKSKPTESISYKGRSRMLLLVVLIGVFAVIGYFIGNATKKSPSIIKLYNEKERSSISKEEITKINEQIHEIEHDRAHIIEQSTLPDDEQPMLSESEREEMIHNYNVRMDQLTMQRAEYKEIGGLENKDQRIQNLHKEIELNGNEQSEIESKINDLMPHIETDPDAQKGIEQFNREIKLLQQKMGDMERELEHLLD